MKFLFLSDLHAASPMCEVYRDVIRWIGTEIESKQADVVVFGGDLGQNDETSAIDELVAALPDTETRAWLPGNRDPNIADLVAKRGDVGIGVTGHHVMDCDWPARENLIQPL